MKFLALNINKALNQEWYCRLTTVNDCYRYFERLGPGDGDPAAIYDVEEKEYYWIDMRADRTQADRIVRAALAQPRPQPSLW